MSAYPIAGNPVPGLVDPNPHLTDDQVRRLIEIVEEEEPVIIGGQALNLWAQYFEARGHPEFSPEAPLTSKDLDFYRNKEAAERLAEELNGEVLLPTLDDATPNAAVVLGRLDGRLIEVDFMAAVLGVEGRRIENNRVVLSGSVPGSDRKIQMLLLHPLDCLRSRLANVNMLGRNDPHSVRQARISIDVLKAFLDDLLGQAGGWKHVQSVLLDLSYVIREAHLGKPTHVIHRLPVTSVFDGFEDHPRLDERWRRKILAPCVQRVAKWTETANTKLGKPPSI